MEREKRKSIKSRHPLTDEDISLYKKNAKAHTLANNNDAVIHGYLIKYNQRGKAQTRFCIIHKGAFFYFKDDESTRPCGIFKLEGYQAQIEDNSCNVNKFQVKHQQKAECRSYSFCAATKEEQSNWVESINNHVIEYFPVSLYPVNEQSDYDYVPMPDVSPPVREYFTQEAQKHTKRTASVRSTRCQSNIMTAGYACMSDCNENNILTDGYVAMGERNMNAAESSTMGHSQYVDMSGGHTFHDVSNVVEGTYDENDLPGRKTRVVSDPPPMTSQLVQEWNRSALLPSALKTNCRLQSREIDVRTAKMQGYACMSDSSENNILTDGYVTMGERAMNAAESSMTEHSNYVDMSGEGTSDETDISATQSICLGRDNRTVSDSSPMTSQLVQGWNRSASLPSALKTNCRLQSREIDVRTANLPPVPELQPSIRGELSICDQDIIPKNSMNASFQKKECLDLLCPFEVGTYMIRSTRDGKDAIAVLANKDPPKVKHFIMFERSDGRKYLHQGDPKFETSQELIRHYYCNELPRTELKLIKPLSTLTDRIEGNAYNS